MEWAKTNWKFIATILTIVAAAFGVKFTIQPAPAGTDPQVVVVIPGLDAEPMFVQGKAPEEAVAAAGAGGRKHHPIVNLACRFAGQRYARENGMTPAQGRLMALSLDPKVITDRIEQDKMLPDGETMASIPVAGGKLSDWLAAHPDFFNNLIKLIIMLIPLFAADAHDAGLPWLLLLDTHVSFLPAPPPSPDELLPTAPAALRGAVQVAQRRLPVAWERPYHPLAC